MMEEVLCLHAIVHGKVQGVGFRAFIELQAIEKGLQGWVQNRPDGTVELQAEGPKSVLEAFLQILEKGPQLAQVSQILVDWKDANRQSYGFIIRRD